jgi:GAF domain-containing protein
MLPGAMNTVGDVGEGEVLLERAAERLAGTRQLEEVQSIVASVARRLVGADGATFVLRDGDKCFYVDEDAVGPLWKGQKFPLTACIRGWAMLNRSDFHLPTDEEVALVASLAETAADAIEAVSPAADPVG